MDLTVLAGLFVAALAWTWLFASGQARFWPHAIVAGLVIGAYGALAQRQRLGDLLRPSATDVAIGVTAAAVLYGVFWVGNAALTRLVPSFAAHVSDVYAVQGRTDLATVVLAIVVVGSCEELFWRGFVQERAGFALALAGYAAVLLWERNWALILAALVGGAGWGLLFAWRQNLVAPAVCHALWDLAVVVWLPLAGKTGPRRGAT